MKVLLHLAMLLLAMGAAVVAQNNQQAVLPAEGATTVGLTWIAEYQLSGGTRVQDFADVVELTALNYVNKRAIVTGRPATSNDYASIKSQFDSAASTVVFHGACNDQSACLRQVIDGVETHVNASVGSTMAYVLGELTVAKRTRLEPPLDTRQQNPAQLAMNAVSGNGVLFIRDVISEAVQLGRLDSTLAPTVNAVIGDLVSGMSITSSYAQIKAAFPQIGLISLGTLTATGSYVVAQADLITGWNNAMSPVSAAIDSNLAKLKANAVITSNSALARRGIHEAATTGSSTGSGQDIYKTAEGAASGIGAAVGFLFDKTAGTQFTNVGTAVVKAAKAVNTLAQPGALVLSGLTSVIDLVSPISDIVGAGISIFSSLFGSSNNQAAANQAILNAISKLSQQLAGVQADMDSQFLKVNQTLATILGTLNSNFALINYSLGTLSADVSQVQTALLDTQVQLNQLATLSLAYQEDATYSGWIAAIDACDNYAVIHPGADIGLSAWNACESSYYPAIVQQASGPIWAYIQSPSYNDGDLYSIFATANVSGVCTACPTPSSVLVNYFAQWPVSVGLPFLYPNRLANPAVYALMVRAYLNLYQQWPQYASTISSSRLNDVIAVGAALQSAINAGNVNSSGTPNPSVLNAAASKYMNTTSSVVSMLQNEVSKFAQSPTSGVTNPSTGAAPQLFTSAMNQKTSYVPPMSSITFCDGTALGTMPSGLMTQVLDRYRLMQGYLSAGTITACVNAAWTNVHPANCATEPCGLTGENFPSGWIIRNSSNPQAGTLSVTVVFNYNGTPIASATSTKLALYSFSSEVDKNPETWATLSMDGPTATALNWTSGLSLMQLVQGAKVVSTAPAALDAQVTAALDAATASLEAKLYSQIAAVLGSTTTQRTLAQELTGFKDLIGGYCSLLLPHYCQSTAMQALLSGSSPLLGVDDLVNFFTAASQAPINVTVNQVATEEAALTTAAQGLSSAINQVYANVSANGADTNTEVTTNVLDAQALSNAKQRGAIPCLVTLAQKNWTAATLGDSISIPAQTTPGCTTSISSRASWLTTSLSNGNLTVTALTNATGDARSGMVVVGDAGLIVVQSAAAPVAPQFNSSATATSPAAAGLPSTVKLQITCTGGSLKNGAIQILIYDPLGGQALLQNFTGQNFTTGQSQTYSVTLTPSMAGPYNIEAGVFDTSSGPWVGLNWNSNAGTINVPSAIKVASSANPASAAPGASTSIALTVTGLVSLTNTNVELKIADTSGKQILTTSWSGQSFTAGQNQKYTYVWTPPANLPPGTYSIQAGVFSSDWQLTYGWANAGTVAVSSAQFKSSSTATPPAYAGLSTTVNVMVTCSSGSISGAAVQVMIFDLFGNQVVLQNFTGQNFTSGQTQTYSVPLITRLAGPYNVEVGVFDTSSGPWQGLNWNSAAGTVNVPSAFKITAAAPASVVAGSNANVSVTVASIIAASLPNTIVELQLFDPTGKAVATTTWSTQTFAAGQSHSYTYPWTPSATLPSGTYSIQAGVFSGDWKITYGWSTIGTITVAVH